MVTAVEIERWRSYFGKAGADIWMVIQQAINIAAIDFPMDFRERRGEIAETLFARNLVAMHVKATNHDFKFITLGEHELEDSDGRPHLQAKRGIPGDDVTGITHHVIRPNDEDDDDDDDDGVHENCHTGLQDASAEPEKGGLLIRDINGIKASIMDGDQPDNAVVEALQRLQNMQITVGALKATEIGKQVKTLKKHSSKRVRALVKELVRDWKMLVDEWAKSATDVSNAVAETGTGDCLNRRIDEEGRLPLPPVNEGVHQEAGVSSMDLSKLFSYVDEEICTEDKDHRRYSTSVEPSVKDNVNYLSRSLSESIITDSSDLDTKASTNHPWGYRTPEERGSATRDVYPPSGDFEKKDMFLKGQISQPNKVLSDMDNAWGLQPSKAMANNINPGKQCMEVLKAKPMSGGKQGKGRDAVNQTRIGQKEAAMHASSADAALSSKYEKNEVDHKLEIAKRKLHQGYQQAENAKKQRTVQVLDFQEGVKAGQLVKSKMNLPVPNKGMPPAKNRAVFQNSHGSQNRRVA